MTTAKPITLIPVPPLRTTTSLAFVTRSTDTEGEGGGMEQVPWTTYPESPLAVEMRRLRRDLGLHLGEAGVALGFDALTFSRLERGAFTMTEEERARAEVLLRAAGEAKGPRREIGPPVTLPKFLTGVLVDETEADR
jgi:hypothetical protein